MMTWTENDLKKLRDKGYKIDDKINSSENSNSSKPKTKIVKISIEKQTIELFLKQFKEKGLIDDYVSELKFHDTRKFRFDWAIPRFKIAIEYEGLFSEKSRHTTVSGFSEDCTKYNLAIANGWKVLRYTAINYKDLYTDLEKLLKQ
jgi:hypothetical protein